MFLTWKWRKTGKNIDPLYILDYFSGFVFESHPWWNSKRQTFPTIQTPVSWASSKTKLYIACNFDIVDPSAPDLSASSVQRSTRFKPVFFSPKYLGNCRRDTSFRCPQGDPPRERVKLGDPTLIPHGAKVGWRYHVLGNQKIGQPGYGCPKRLVTLHAFPGGSQKLRDTIAMVYPSKHQ